MTAHSTHLVLVPGLACTEDLFAEQIATLRGEIAISVAEHTRHDTMSAIARAVLATAPNRFAVELVLDLTGGAFLEEASLLLTVVRQRSFFPSQWGWRQGMFEPRA
jgi:hypothetical protein